MMKCKDEKKKELTILMNGLVDKIKKGTGEGWIEEYAHKFVEVWGKEEAGRQCRAIMQGQHVTESENVFCSIVRDLLFEKKQL